MQNESIIKVIGHRPVYRVEKHRTQGWQALMEGLGHALPGAPVIDQEQRGRMLSGSEEAVLQEAAV